MADEWILDVLADLKAFARKNGLVALAEQLDDTSLVAATELASIQVDGVRVTLTDAAETGGISRTN